MVLTFAAAAGGSAFGAWLVSRHAVSLGLVDRPTERSSHKRPTPRGGGLGLLLAWLVAGLVLHPPLVLWAAVCAMSLLGLWDDLKNLPAKGRLLAQIALAAVAVATISSGPSGLFFLPLAGFWVLYLVGTANFFNFMDGINGIAGIMGCVSLGLVAVMTWGEPSPVPGIALTMAVACLGFLPFNVPRARVFMGDVGSLLLGFLFAALVAIAATDFPRFLCLLSFQLIFYADALTTLFIRWCDGESLTQAHRRHLYQVLANELGVAHARVALVYGGIQTVVGGAMVVAWRLGLFWQGVVFSVSCLLYLALMHRCRRLAALERHG